jgi:hypothetical protein
VKFIIRAGSGTVTDTLRDQLRASPQLAVLDETPKMLLVEADSELALRSAADLSGLLVVPERHYDPPETT